ncbi:bacterioferritin [Leptospira borgpetersenii]|uniref:Bacterioferritin n=2 Tax=Leptospira borgpetersenii serovar Hardjo-bovis TaxID=338217 RepID=Q04TW6_LEPBJ|nr:bacterioferritin [Leptospira borgpetersenii]ABJ75654.1 Bacterioferritin (cytochrome b1) [Leptospira borgpetersenii serovar Hardjo-bovis str. JB197]ABJ79436.1 Bacterioferritin [Leptospira borgpetersenii serovar Hardjo-bovis str. L550]AMX58760.1 bacterioferritin [Leptospira borgpetersenii serovar Hardjo]AMX62014.1 bacterioferritin [Leptospira borgpetersenii serovar Hardjo]AMX65257.1 bacterioferritin [Leptospira borgpetersenii serovar Hardjo]
MKGNKEVLDILAEVLSAELTAINQYFIHAKMNKNWGFKKLADFMKHESIDEMKHADEVIDRILYLDGVPDLQKYMKINVGKNIEEILKVDLDLEYAAVERFNRGIAIAAKNNDNGTRELFEKILVSEEEHIDWIESQQEIIRQIGVENYLAQQIE